MTRNPAVAGTFYPSDPGELREMLKWFEANAKVPDIKPASGISPHAGYVYSGLVAAHTYLAIRNAKPEVVAIVGPDHVGLASALGETAIYPDGEWKTPLGSLKVNSEIARVLEKKVTNGNLDPDAHTMEHSIEVQLPFIQYFLGSPEIVPIMLGDQSLEIARSVATALNDVLPRDAVVIASSDMSHYVPVETARENDIYALKAIESMDEVEFYKRIAERNVSACGYGAIAVAEIFAKLRNAKKGMILKYATSSDVTNDPVCVGYASVVFI